MKYLPDEYKNRGVKISYNFLNKIGQNPKYVGAIVSLWPKFNTSRQAKAKLEKRFQFYLADIMHDYRLFRLYKWLEDREAAVELLIIGPRAFER